MPNFDETPARPLAGVSSSPGAADRSRLVAVLERSQELGFLGPGPVTDHIERALHAVDVILPLAPDEPGRAVHIMDLGSGGGLPGLPLCLALPASWHWILLDGSVTRTRFLAEAVEELDLAGRVTVVTARAEEAGRRADLRGSLDLVVARSFGAPAVTAECSAGFLRPAGHLVVAEPPGGDPTRWPVEGLAPLGLEPVVLHQGPTTFQVIAARTPCPDRYPRRVGVPAKRPLF